MCVIRRKWTHGVSYFFGGGVEGKVAASFLRNAIKDRRVSTVACITIGKFSRFWYLAVLGTWWGLAQLQNS